MIYHGCESYSLDDLPQTIEKAVRDLMPHKKKFSSIVVTGMSGVIVGIPVSLDLKKPLVIIRKDSDDSHHGAGRIINKKRMGKRCLFLDDFISTGVTYRDIKSIVLINDARITCTYMYNGMSIHHGDFEVVV